MSPPGVGVFKAAALAAAPPPAPTHLPSCPACLPVCWPDPVCSLCAGLQPPQQTARPDLLFLILCTLSSTEFSSMTDAPIAWPLNWPKTQPFNQPSQNFCPCRRTSPTADPAQSPRMPPTPPFLHPVPPSKPNHPPLPSTCSVLCLPLPATPKCCTFGVRPACKVNHTVGPVQVGGWVVGVKGGWPSKAWQQLLGAGGA